MSKDMVLLLSMWFDKLCNASFCFCFFQDIFPDKATERNILSCHVRCPSEGCEWTGETRNIEVTTTHAFKLVQLCRFRKVPFNSIPISTVPHLLLTTAHTFCASRDRNSRSCRQNFKNCWVQSVITTTFIYTRINNYGNVDVIGWMYESFWGFH